MNRLPVTSSNLRAVGYDAQVQVLEVEFQSGGIYQYFRVPHAVYNRLMSSPSKGTYFDSGIRTLYSYQKVA